MKNKILLGLVFFWVLVFLGGCASAPKPQMYGGALQELMRSGVPQVELYPEYYHRVAHTCTSTPIYSLSGEYVRTDVRCF